MLYGSFCPRPFHVGYERRVDLEALEAANRKALVVAANTA
jgi:hypothetical protein